MEKREREEEKKDQCLFHYITDSFTEQSERRKKEKKTKRTNNLAIICNYRITFVLKGLSSFFFLNKYEN